MSDICCEFHGGATKCQDGTWLCCHQEEWSAIPTDPPTTKPNPPSPEVRAAIAAAVGPKGDRDG